MFWKKDKMSLKKPRSLLHQFILYQIFMTMSIVIVVCFLLFPKFDTIIHFAHLNYQHGFWEACIRNIILALIFSLVSSIGFGYWAASKNMQAISRLSNQI